MSSECPTLFDEDPAGTDVLCLDHFLHFFDNVKDIESYFSDKN